ncbi:MAG: 50S ribosomal protein L11 methyltransferase [Mariprofundus sp.]|nr:50S ribosomal protein L11 methyltransferase [Mariprofundus sp.]
MQASKCLELRIPAVDVTEKVFESLTCGLGAVGLAEETDVDSAFTERVGWFVIDNNEADLRQQISIAALAQGLVSDSMTLNTLEQQNWETAWQKDWQTIPVGKNLWVRPSFCDAPTDGRIDIVLDPGMAFGTGTHPTTQLCLEAIERFCTEHSPATLLDMGAGSGLLAITALKLGVDSALAVDMEKDSVQACHTNAAINGVHLDVKLDDSPPHQTFDLVVANILAAPLVWMAKELAATVGDQLILSGLLGTQVDDVTAAYVAEGLTEVRRDSQGEWASVELKR